MPKLFMVNLPKSDTNISEVLARNGLTDVDAFNVRSAVRGVAVCHVLKAVARLLAEAKAARSTAAEYARHSDVKGATYEGSRAFRMEEDARAILAEVLR